jgi:hypothetical protein
LTQKRVWTAAKNGASFTMKSLSAEQNHEYLASCC